MRLVDSSGSVSLSDDEVSSEDDDPEDDEPDDSVDGLRGRRFRFTDLLPWPFWMKASPPTRSQKYLSILFRAML